jgi:hypothetical protein
MSRIYRQLHQYAMNVVINSIGNQLPLLHNVWENRDIYSPKWDLSGYPLFAIGGMAIARVVELLLRPYHITNLNLVRCITSVSPNLR